MQKRTKIILLVSGLTVVLIAAALLVLSNFKNKVTTLTHKSKGYSISLGMKKEDVDEILDEENDYEFFPHMKMTLQLTMRMDA